MRQVMSFANSLFGIDWAESFVNRVIRSVVHLYFSIDILGGADFNLFITSHLMDNCNKLDYITAEVHKTDTQNCIPTGGNCGGGGGNDNS